MKKTVKSKKKLLEWFEKHGWEDNGDYFELINAHDQCFNHEMFFFCDKEIDVVAADIEGYNFESRNKDDYWSWKKGWFVKKKQNNEINS